MYILILDTDAATIAIGAELFMTITNTQSRTKASHWIKPSGNTVQLGRNDC